MEVPRRIRKPATVVAVVVAGLALAGCTPQEEAPNNIVLAESTHNLERTPELDDYQDAQINISSGDISNDEALAIAIVSGQLYDDIITDVSDLDDINYEGLAVIKSENGTRRIMTPTEVLVARLINSGGAHSDFFKDFYYTQCEITGTDCESTTIHDNYTAFHATVNKLEDILGPWYASHGFRKDTIAIDDIKLDELELILEGVSPTVHASSNTSSNNAVTDGTYVIPLDEINEADLVEFSNPMTKEKKDGYYDEEVRAEARSRVENILSDYEFNISDMPEDVMSYFAFKIYDDPTYEDTIKSLANKYPSCLPYVIMMPFKDSFPEYEAQPFDGDIVELEDIDMWPEAIQVLPHDKSVDPQTCPAIAIHP